MGEKWTMVIQYSIDAVFLKSAVTKINNVVPMDGQIRHQIGNGHTFMTTEQFRNEVKCCRDKSMVSRKCRQMAAGTGVKCRSYDHQAPSKHI